jgi:uncharacterized protein YbbC (DUF1343 family)
MAATVQFGVDALLPQAAKYKGQRIGMVTNDAATTSGGQLSRVALLQAGFGITQLFAPEHGMARAGEDGTPQPNHTDAATGLPVTSLYGEKLAPTAADLQELDLLLFDIPDIGCRFYTYLWTMTHLMQACATHHKPLLIADRPNPTGAQLHLAEGPWLDEASCSSFIGRWNIPIRHCCTLGELARYFAATRVPGLELTVIKAPGYQRHHLAGQAFAFVPTSPAMRSMQSAMLYPGTGLWEGVNLNEGRGTAAPFALCGAPWLNNQALAKQLYTEGPLRVLPVNFTAAIGPYTGQHCNGLLLTITDAAAHRPVQSGLALLAAIAQLHPLELQPRTYPTAANPGGSQHLDKLLGQPNAFAQLLSGQPFATDVAEEWRGMMGHFLLY